MMADTPQSRRRERVAERLRVALAALETDPDASLTAASLARLAGVSRNTLYTSHRPILDALNALRTARQPVLAREVQTGGSRAKHDAQMRALATQNAGLLQRALAAEQRAARLEDRNAELVRTLDAIRKPAPITTVETDELEG